MVQKIVVEINAAAIPGRNACSANVSITELEWDSTDPDDESRAFLDPLAHLDCRGTGDSDSDAIAHALTNLAVLIKTLSKG